MSEWQTMETAPKFRYFLACVEANQSELKLLKQLGMSLDGTPEHEIIIAYKRKGDPKHKVRSSPHGRLHNATHWQPLPRLPEITTE